jgi:hypothetical protein
MGKALRSIQQEIERAGLAAVPAVAGQVDAVNGKRTRIDLGTACSYTI